MKRSSTSKTSATCVQDDRMTDVVRHGSQRAQNCILTKVTQIRTKSKCSWSKNTFKIRSYTTHSIHRNWSEFYYTTKLVTANTPSWWPRQSATLAGTPQIARWDERMMRPSAVSYADLLACLYSRGTAIVEYHFQVVTGQTIALPLHAWTAWSWVHSEPCASPIGCLGT